MPPLQVLMEGNVWKQTKTFHKWCQRYLVLTSKSLTVFSDASQTKDKHHHVYDIDAVTCSLSQDFSAADVFEVGIEGHVHRLRVRGCECANKWVEAIRISRSAKRISPVVSPIPRAKSETLLVSTKPRRASARRRRASYNSRSRRRREILFNLDGRSLAASPRSLASVSQSGVSRLRNYSSVHCLSDDNDINLVEKKSYDDESRVRARKRWRLLRNLTIAIRHKKKSKLSDKNRENKHILDKHFWIQKSEVDVCCLCNETFNFFKHRKHHCRLCGRVMCDKCTRGRDFFDGAKGKQRICDICVDDIGDEIVGAWGFSGDSWVESRSPKTNGEIRFSCASQSDIVIMPTSPEIRAKTPIYRNSVNTSFSSDIFDCGRTSTMSGAEIFKDSISQSNYSNETQLGSDVESINFDLRLSPNVSASSTSSKHLKWIDKQNPLLAHQLEKAIIRTKERNNIILQKVESHNS